MLSYKPCKTCQPVQTGCNAFSMLMLTTHMGGVNPFREMWVKLSQTGICPQLTLQAQQCAPLLVSLQRAAIAAVGAFGLPVCMITATCCRPGPRTLPQ